MDNDRVPPQEGLPPPPRRPVATATEGLVRPTSTRAAGSASRRVNARPTSSLRRAVQRVRARGALQIAAMNRSTSAGTDPGRRGGEERQVRLAPPARVASRAVIGRSSTPDRQVQKEIVSSRSVGQGRQEAIRICSRSWSPRSARTARSGALLASSSARAREKKDDFAPRSQASASPSPCHAPSTGKDPPQLSGEALMGPRATALPRSRVHRRRHRRCRRGDQRRLALVVGAATSFRGVSSSARA